MSTVVLGWIWYEHQSDLIDYDPIVVQAYQDYEMTSDYVDRSNFENWWRKTVSRRDQAYCTEAVGLASVWLTGLLAVVCSIFMSRMKIEKEPK